jgi:hypothetical protein
MTLFQKLVLLLLGSIVVELGIMTSTRLPMSPAVAASSTSPIPVVLVGRPNVPAGCPVVTAENCVRVDMGGRLVVVADSH